MRKLRGILRAPTCCAFGQSALALASSKRSHRTVGCRAYVRARSVMLLICNPPRPHGSSTRFCHVGVPVI
jgi:hypothetical protein